MAGYANAFSNLAFAFVKHGQALQAANSGKDLTTLVVKDLPTVRNAAAAGNKDDVNTAYAEYLLTHN